MQSRDLICAEVKKGYEVISVGEGVNYSFPCASQIFLFSFAVSYSEEGGTEAV